MKTKKKKTITSKTPVIVAGIIVVAAVIGILFFINSGNTKISLKTETVEAGETTDLTALADISKKTLENYTLSVDKKDFNQNKLGKYTVDYILTNKEDKSTSKKSFDIEVVDTRAPLIIGDEIMYTKINKPIKISNHISADDSFEGQLKPESIDITGPEIDYSKNGKYNIQVKATDSSGNVSEKKIIVSIGGGGSSKKISQKINGYWKSEAPKWSSDSYQILQFRYKNGNCYYGGLTWGGNLKFDYINYDNTLATGIVKIETSKKTWTESFFIDIGDPDDKILHVTFKRGQKIILANDLTYLGDSLDEAKRKLDE